MFVFYVLDPKGIVRETLQSDLVRFVRDTLQSGIVGETLQSDLVR